MGCFDLTRLCNWSPSKSLGYGNTFVLKPQMIVYFADTALVFY